ncbi:hypothetical protein [Aquirhabdus sp.]|uniref:hypothetical protein n=1 Tax=Aquirhabdus sp. TaxID=2824160 RepID=UPI00396C422A
MCKFWIGFFLLLGVVIAGYFYWIMAHGELSTKADYALLQGIEFEHRNLTGQANPVVITSTTTGIRAVVLGLATQDSHYPRTWILLNRVDADGKILMVPQVPNILVDCQYVALLKTENEINPKVLYFLQEKCSN